MPINISKALVAKLPDDTDQAPKILQALFLSGSRVHRETNDQSVLALIVDRG